MTAVCFSPDGLYVAAGLMDGHVFLYETADLKYYTQIACIRKNKKLSTRDKRKVTSVSFIASRGYTASDLSIRRAATATKDKYNLLVTTNDSRIRIFSMSDFTLIMKLKGPQNSSRQIRASSTLDGTKIICGSDTGDVFIWKLPHHVVENPTRHMSLDVGEDNQQKGSQPSQSLPLPGGSMTVECHVIPAQLKSTKHGTLLANSSTNNGNVTGPNAGTREIFPPCTTTAFIPLNAIHLTHTALQVEDTDTSLRIMTTTSKYTAEDSNCLAILSAEYDGSLHVLYTSG